MSRPMPASIPTHKTSPALQFGANSCWDCDSSTAFAQPQHHTAASTRGPGGDPEQHSYNRQDRKRCSVDSRTEHCGLVLLSTPPTPKKKRRVTFCTTAKPPSNMKQPPPRKTNELIINNDVTTSSSSASSPLPLPHSAFLASESLMGELDLNSCPAAFVHTLLLHTQITAGSTLVRGEDLLRDASRRVQHSSYYLTYEEEHLASYTTDKVKAVQRNDVETLRSLHASGHVMQASNRFGESLLHTACRRGYTDMVGFFLHEARVCPRVRDDVGRTPMHDVCWSSAAPNHHIMTMLVREAPEMLLCKDKRGHSPFDYARREHWPNWVSFLNEHRQLITNSMVSSSLASERFRL